MQIGNEERGIFKKLRSSRILQLNDKIPKKKLNLPMVVVHPRIDNQRVSKKRKYNEMGLDDRAEHIEVENEREVKQSRDTIAKEREVTLNQYLTEYKIECPKDFHYENYFSTKRDELQGLLLNDPLMSVDDLLELESLKLVFGTSAVKKDRDEYEDIGEKVDSAVRRRRFYDFSETNVKIDEIMSKSPEGQREEPIQVLVDRERAFMKEKGQENYYERKEGVYKQLRDHPNEQMNDIYRENIPSKPKLYAEEQYRRPMDYKQTRSNQEQMYKKSREPLKPVHQNIFSKEKASLVEKYLPYRDSPESYRVRSYFEPSLRKFHGDDVHMLREAFEKDSRYFHQPRENRYKEDKRSLDSKNSSYQQPTFKEPMHYREALPHPYNIINPNREQMSSDSGYFMQPSFKQNLRTNPETHNFREVYDDVDIRQGFNMINVPSQVNRRFHPEDKENYYEFREHDMSSRMNYPGRQNYNKYH